MKATITLAAFLTLGAAAITSSPQAVASNPPASISKTTVFTLPMVHAQIARAKVVNPAAFARVDAIRNMVPTLDRKKRGRLAVVAPYLRALGTDGIHPMLDLLSSSSALGTLSDSAKIALQVGLLEAVGSLRNPLSAPVLEQILTGPESNSSVVRAAAEAFGKLGDDASAAKLIAWAGQFGPKRTPILASLGDCRREAVAKALAGTLASNLDEPAILAVVHSLGTIGSSWAWHTPELAASSEKDAVRSVAAESLIKAFVQHSGDVRRAAETSLLVIDFPSTPAWIAAAREKAPADTQAALDQLAERFARNPARSP